MHAVIINYNRGKQLARKSIMKEIRKSENYSKELAQPPQEKSPQLKTTRAGE